MAGKGIIEQLGRHGLIPSEAGLARSIRGAGPSRLLGRMSLVPAKGAKYQAGLMDSK